MSLARQYDVIIIGGGATGAGTARDCALRGLKVLLVERKDFATGATGRNHGLLHSGARYAVTDQVSAAECVAENKIIRHIARHCVEPTDGLFITLPEDDLGYQDTFVSACLSAGIDAEVISPDEARRIEPAVNPNLIGAVKVPDCAVDPFRLARLISGYIPYILRCIFHNHIYFYKCNNFFGGSRCIHNEIINIQRNTFTIFVSFLP